MSPTKAVVSPWDFSSSDEKFEALLKSLTVERILTAYEKFGITLQGTWGQISINMLEEVKSLRQNALSHHVLHEGLVAA